MSFSDIFMIWSGAPGVSAIIWFAIIVTLLYLARTPAHDAIQATAKAIHNALRLTARVILKTEEKLKLRNREVLLEAGREAAERYVEREFHRVEESIKRDLDSYPTLHRKLHTEITKIEEDYHNTADVPPAPPGWVKAVESVAKIKSTGDPMVANVLTDIHHSLEEAQNEAIVEYRKASQGRQQALKKLHPYWRKVTTSLGELEKRIQRVLDRAHEIDLHMAKYEQILQGTDRAIRNLSSSAIQQFFISFLVLFVAVGGAVINFHLIAYPMQEMVGGNSYIMNFKTSNIAGLFIVTIEIAMGLFLMESLRITRLFPIIGSMDDKMRYRMIWITLTILTLLAGVEAALAYMRDTLMADNQALKEMLSGQEFVAAGAESAAISNWIPTIGQMVMGFILPFALTFVAIPLESFLHAARTVFGMLVEMALRFVAFCLRQIGHAVHYLGYVLVKVYDLVIFGPLWIENAFKSKKPDTGARSVTRADPPKPGAPLERTIP